MILKKEWDVMKTNFEKIVHIEEIGKANTAKLNDLLTLAKQEKFKPSVEDKEKVLFIGIDFQNDFMENGELGVLNSHKDIENTTHFLYRNLEKITDIAVSLDTHELHQIFHPCWWVDEQGNHPNPFTIITAENVKTGKWKAINYEKASADYVENLEKIGKKQLCIWSYHCIEGTFGAALEGQFSNMIHFHSIVRKTPIQKITKGKDPLSEMYGIIKPEYSLYAEGENTEFLLSLKNYDKIFIAGEAKSHCVLESVRQIVEFYDHKKELTKNIYLLEDCTSPIAGYEETTEQAFQELEKTYGIQRVLSTEVTL